MEKKAITIIEEGNTQLEPVSPLSYTHYNLLQQTIKQCSFSSLNENTHMHKAGEAHFIFHILKDTFLTNKYDFQENIKENISANPVLVLLLPRQPESPKEELQNKHIKNVQSSQS